MSFEVNALAKIARAVLYLVSINRPVEPLQAQLIGAATLMILGSGFCPDSSWRSCFASSRQCTLSERSSRNASCAMDNASRNPSTSARNAPVSGLLAGVERINRKMDFVPPVSRFAVADVSAMGGPRDGNRIEGEPRHERVDESLPPIPGRKVPCGARPSVGQVTDRKGHSGLIRIHHTAPRAWRSHAECSLALQRAENVAGHDCGYLQY